jgi:WD40 repeat protein
MTNAECRMSNVEWCERSPNGATPAMLYRARRYCQAFLARHKAKDVGASGIVAWSPDGRQLACAHEGGHRYVGIWDTTSWQCTNYFRAPADQPVCGSAWSPDGKYLAVCSSHREGSCSSMGVLLYETVCEKVVWKQQEQRARIFAAHMSPDGRRLACIHEGGGFGAHIWDLRSGELKAAIAALARAARAAWSPDGKVLATDMPKGGGVSLWDGEAGSGLRECRFPDPKEAHSRLAALAFSPDGRRLAAAGTWGGVPTIFDSVTGKALGRLSEKKAGTENVLAFSPDGRMIALGGEGSAKRLALWNAKTGRLLASLTGPGKNQRGLAWSPDSRALVCGGMDGKPVVWTLRGAGRTGVLGDTGCPIRAVAWSPDGKTIAAGESVSAIGAGASVRLLDARTGRALRPLRAHPGDIQSLCWSREGKVLMSASTLMVRLWDPATGRPDLTIFTTGRSAGVAIRGEGHFRASGDFDPGKGLVYVVVTPDGQETLSPADFSKRYGWENDPAKVAP